MANTGGEIESESAPKRQKLQAEKGKHAPGYKEWERNFTWLDQVRNSESGQVVGLICRLCKQHKRKNKFNQSTVWSETPCSTVCKDAIRCHSLSQQHKEAVEMEACREVADRHGGIEQALQTQLDVKKEEVKTAMQCLY